MLQYHVMKTYSGLFLSLVLVSDYLSDLSSGRFIPRERALGIQSTGGCVG
jgi:hypothetical protein